MAKYNYRDVELKWQNKWDAEKVYRARNPGDSGFDPTQKPYYVLDMFPYPSGSGLHVGHASGYIGTDIVARHRRMLGYNVLHPMGWDAFGLPAEQYAIQTNQHPRQITDVNTANFRRQLKLIGLSYDWDREVDTSDPSYYRWTQWIFLQLYKKGMVYRKEMPVWWCEELKTVLANEEVINGRSERGNYICERRPLTQWVFKITAYADRLLEDLDLLDWPESVRKMQADWIGKSLGAEIDFAIDSKIDSKVESKTDSALITVFSTRPDTLFGVTALVLAPEHPLVSKITTAAQRASVDAYVKRAASKSDRERKADADKITAENTGAFALHPLTGEKVPVFIGDYVLADYGTGAVMAVPAHDERDFELAKSTKIAIKKVIKPASGDDKDCFTDPGLMTNSGEFDGLTTEDGKIQVTAALEKKKAGRARTTYKIRDWIFSRQRYWGEPFPLLLDEKDQIVLAEEIDLPIELPPMTDFQPSSDGSSPLNRASDWVHVTDKSGRKLKRVTDTMPGWAGSCWYYLRFMDPKNDKAAFSLEAIEYWKQVDLYVGGASHAVMHLLYARFWHKVLFDIGLVKEKEPFKKLYNQGMVTAFAFKDSTSRLVPTDEVEQKGMDYFRKSNGERVERFISKMAKSLRNVVNPDDVIKAKGCDAFRLYEMFMGPLDSEKPWTDDGIAGCEGFLKKLWNTCTLEEGGLKLHTGPESEKIWRSLHKALKRTNDSFELFNFNTAIAGMMEGLNEIRDSGDVMTRAQMEFFMKMLAPFAPHMASEIWTMLGNQTLIDFAAWPHFDAAKIVESDFELVLQVNGKIRKKVRAPINMEESLAIPLAHKELAEHLVGKEIVKSIYVKNKLMNIVVKP
jgi:leucyl-tRNA synthetase